MVSGFDDIGKQFSILTEVVMWEAKLVEIYFLNDSHSFSLLFCWVYYGNANDGLN